MSKYLLSTKQKAAFKAVLNGIKREAYRKDKTKIGKNSYSAFEHSVFITRANFDKNADRLFAEKNANFSTKWKRSWNSIPTISEIEKLAKEEFNAEVKSIKKRLDPKSKKVVVEKERLNKVSMDKFYAALEKSKISSKQTKNVKELVAVENLISKKVVSFIKDLYSKKSSDYHEENVERFSKNIPTLISKAFSDKKDFIELSFSHIDNEYLGYRKEILDMRSQAETNYSNSFRWCSNKQEREELRIKAEKEDIRDNKWYRDYLSSQKRVFALINSSYFTTQIGNIVSDAEGLDTWEPQRESQIYTLNLFMDSNGNLRTSYDSLENDCWSEIPRGYDFNTTAKIRFNFAFSTNKTKSFVTDDRKLKTLIKEVSKEQSAIDKVNAKIREV